MVKAKKAVLEKAPVPPVVSSEEKHPRMLIVEFQGGTPKFVFKGEWSVRNLLTIRRCLGREFKLYRRDIIRNNITNEGE